MGFVSKRKNTYCPITLLSSSSAILMNEHLQPEFKEAPGPSFKPGAKPFMNECSQDAIGFNTKEKDPSSKGLIFWSSAQQIVYFGAKLDKIVCQEGGGEYIWEFWGHPDSRPRLRRAVFYNE